MLEKRPGDIAHVLQIDDSRIWSKLPEDLLDEILAKIPPFTIFCLRSVCKRWNSLIQDPSFTNCHSKVYSHHVPCLLTFCKNSRQVSVFSLPLKRCFKIPFDFLPSWNKFWLVGSSGGLVCLAGLDNGLTTFNFLVCNPLTQKWRILPSMHNNNRSRQLILVADRLNRSFKVIAPGDELLPTEVYNSKTDQWSLHHIITKLDYMKVGYCDSRLYTKSLSPPGLRMYRIDTGEWETLISKIPACLSNSYFISGAQKRLFLVAKVFNCVKIWEFDNTEVVWVEICRMPEEHLKDLGGVISDWIFGCFGQDNFICFTSRSQGKAILFDVDKKIWSWVNGFEEALRLFMNRICFYEPRFDAFV